MNQKWKLNKINKNIVDIFLDCIPQGYTKLNSVEIDFGIMPDNNFSVSFRVFRLLLIILNRSKKISSLLLNKFAYIDTIDEDEDNTDNIFKIFLNKIIDFLDNSDDNKNVFIFFTYKNKKVYIYLFMPDSIYWSALGPTFMRPYGVFRGFNINDCLYICIKQEFKDFILQYENSID